MWEVHYTHMHLNKQINTKSYSHLEVRISPSASLCQKNKLSSVLDSKASSWLSEIKQLSPAPANMSRHVWTWHWFFCISYQICKDWSLQEHQREFQGQDTTMKVNWLINQTEEHRRPQNSYRKHHFRCSCRSGSDLFNERLDMIHKEQRSSWVNN